MVSAALMAPTALTIAGSDSGGGAGIQADLKTFEAFGVFGTSAVTAITAQNTKGVQGVLVLPPAMVAMQIDSVLDDIGADAIKVGMLADVPTIRVVAERLRFYGVTNLVVDPVMVAKSGDKLLADEAREALLEEILPLARLVTPNLHEAAQLLGRPVDTVEAMQAAAREFVKRGAGAAVVKGGHLLDADRAIDVLFDGAVEHRFSKERLATQDTHGTGCTFAAAIAAQLAKGSALHEAVAVAKDYLWNAIRHGAGRGIGAGYGPVDHAWRQRPMSAT